MTVTWVLRLPDSENDLEDSLQGRGRRVFFKRTFPRYISIFPLKEVQEMNQYTKETCPGGGQGGPGGPGNLLGDPGKLTRHKEELH